VLDLLELPDNHLFATFGGSIPAGWSASGLWHTTLLCSTVGACNTGDAAYFGIDTSCTFSNSLAVAGDLFSSVIEIPARAYPASLVYCSNYAGEGGSEVLLDGYDRAWVTVNGVIVDDVSIDVAIGWEERVVDLSAFAGEEIEVGFHFNSVDSAFNSTLGWQIDNVSVSSAPDCNDNDVFDQCESDCDGNGIPDLCEITVEAIDEDFQAGALSAGWTATGLWSVTSSCAAPAICGQTPVAYYGNPAMCTFATAGTANEGDLVSPVVTLPASSLGATLEYCSTYVGEGGTPIGSLGYDWAWVEVNGIIVDVVSSTAITGWERRTVNLSAFLGQSIQVSFRFDSVDGVGNGTLGWQVDSIRLGTAADCNTNGDLDSCDIASGAANDCNANRIPDTCDLASGASSDCDLDGIPDDCALSRIVVDHSFDSGLIPNGALASGLWNVTSTCSVGGCGSGARAYFGDPLVCNFDQGTVTGTFELFPFTVPRESLGAQLVYCSAYEGEGGSALEPSGYDRAWVTVDGQIVDDVGPDGVSPGQVRRISLDAWRGERVSIVFHFDSVDGIANDSLGWQVDDIRVLAAPDCDQNGVHDSCDPDCNGNGRSDACEDGRVFGTGFEAGLPVGWTAAGLWDFTASCIPSGGCDGAPVAYYGSSSLCTIDVGATNGALTSTPISLPANVAAITLRYCSVYDGEQGTPFIPGTYDWAWVEVNGSLVDSVSNTALPGEWETRNVDLSPFAGTSVTIAFHFDTVDAAFNNFLGWQIDGLQIDAKPDCNGNAIDDLCDIGTGASDDCDGNGVPDECDTAGGANDCNLNGIPDPCEVPLVLAQDFTAGTLPAGWIAGGSWNVTDACTEPASCSGGPIAYFGDATQCTYDYGVDLIGDLVLPAISLPAPGGAVQLSFCSRYQGEAGSILGSGYDLAWVEVNGAIEDDISGGAGFGIDTGWESRTVNLSAYAGQTVTISFRFDTIDSCCTDGFLGWQVDDIELVAAPDCNTNGVPDLCDIGGGGSSDVNGNGIPDECEAASFVRGNCNGLDASVNIADAIYLLGYLFPGAGTPNPLGCLDACDTNNDLGLNIADAVTLLSFLFSGGIPLPPPNPATGCGPDTGGSLGCNTSPPPC